MAIIQWVNLEKDDEYAKDPDIGSKDRCGKLTIKTAFAKDSVSIDYKVKVEADKSANVTYSAAELGRNNNFKWTKGKVELSSGSVMLMNDSMQLPAAGGNKYTLEAKDGNGNVVKSAEVETKRKLYYQFMHMEDATGKVTPYSLSQLESHCKKYHIVLSKAGTDKKIPFHKCINSGAGGRFSHVGLATDIQSHYDLAAPLKKVGCVTALSNYIGTYEKVVKKVILNLSGTTNTKVTINASNVSVNILSSTHDFLWYGLDDDDDKAKRWFVHGEIEYSPPPVSSTSAASTSTTVTAPQIIQVNRGDVEIGGTAKRKYGGYQTIDIKLNSNLKAILANKAGNVKFSFTINKVRGFSGGFSWGGLGFALTTCCTKSWFEDNRPADSDVIWNHEVGHRMGMVAYGNKQHATYPRPHLPDAPPTLYGERWGVNNKGHQGSHCEAGALTYSAATNQWSGTPGCVLFGATATATAASPLNYCSDCSRIVRKLDLSF